MARAKNQGTETETAVTAQETAAAETVAGDPSTGVGVEPGPVRPVETPIEFLPPPSGDAVETPVTGVAESSVIRGKTIIDGAGLISSNMLVPGATLGVVTNTAESRFFQVADPLSLDGEDYPIGAPVALTIERHAELLRAGVIVGPWEAGLRR